jgi:hypothetical protein
MTDGINSLTPFPFSKYKGRAVGEVIADTGYVGWLLMQTEFNLRNPALANYLRNGPAKEDSDTPVHNAMQVRYLDKTYCGHLLNVVDNARGELSTLQESIAYFSKLLADAEATRDKALAEKQKAPDLEWDKRIKADKAYQDAQQTVERLKRNDNDNRERADWIKSRLENPSSEIGSVQFEVGNWDVLINQHLAVELKPVISEDYPAIIRKVSQRRGSYESNNSYVVVTDRYTGTSATFDQVKQMFAASGITLLRSTDFEPIPAWLNQQSGGAQ